MAHKNTDKFPPRQRTKPVAIKRDLTPLPVPRNSFSILHGKTLRIRVQGPNEAYALAALWEAMLCRLKVDRALRRQEERPNGFGSEWDELATERLGLQPKLPNRLWHALYAQTLVNFDFEVHAALWAPYADPATGELPATGMHEVFLRHTPDYVLKHVLGDKLGTALSRVTNNTVRGSEYHAPNLRVRVEAPALTLRDRDQLIHCPDGPALVFGDGTGVYFWRGTQVPQEWVPAPKAGWHRGHRGCPALLPRLRPHALPTPRDALSYNNLELRRAACEILGWDNILSVLPNRVVDEDPDPSIGKLVRVSMPMGRLSWQRPVDQQFLRVQCGTGRWFSLAVPPECTSARQANAWTYGLDPSEYEPEVRT